ncbi:AzlC family ABC transporter permease [Brachybacterium sp. FME24]|uniref:AzlC family ABC transporter permease n=1 Tax=Brachybacterium sp. FME24 TaxID=2742605 RepID=UPI0027147B8B|nr:AzlC family ABC transporter permease [Brachybacterium sp. FME24]
MTDLWSDQRSSNAPGLDLFDQPGQSDQPGHGDEPGRFDQPGRGDEFSSWESPGGEPAACAEVDSETALASPAALATPPAASATAPAALVAPPVMPAAPSAEPVAPSRRHEIATGIRLSFAAGLGMFPIGVAFGLLVVQSGLPWWVAPGLSIFLFAGSVELLLVGLMVVGTPLATIALTTLLVNFRHVFYAFSFPLRVVRHPLARLYSVYALIDEAYAVSAARPGTWTGPRLVAMQMAFQSYWVGGGLVGVAIASFLPGQIEGLDFALCALFITLTLDACRSRREIPSLLLAALAFSLALLLVPGSALFAGLLGFLALLVARFLFISRREPADA